MDNIIKYYEFSSKRKAGNLFGLFLLPIFTLFFYLFFRVLFLNKIVNSTSIPSYIDKIIFILLLVIFVCIYIVYHNTLKGVFIYESHIQIVYAITKRNLLNIKPKIKYNEITKCEIIPDTTDNRIKYNISFNFIVGDGDEYVMIETINDKIFFFCVKNQKELIDEINKRIKNSTENVPRA